MLLNHVRRAVLLTTCLTLPFTTLPAFATNYTVANVNDAGAGSLRDAINQAEGNAGADTIDFGNFQSNIVLASDLPTITQGLTINFEGDPAAGSNRINGAFGLNINAAGQNVVFNGSHGYTGNTTVTAGTLQIGAVLAGSTDAIFSASGSLLDIGAAGTLSLTANQSATFRNLTGSGTIINNGGDASSSGLGLFGDVNSTMSTFSGSISGTGSIYMSGGTALTLSGTNNTYSGDTILAAIISFLTPATFGVTLRAGAVNAFSPNSTIVFGGGGGSAVLDLNNFNQAVGNIDGGGGSILLGTARLTTGGNNTSTNYYGAITGTGGITKTGTGVLTLQSTLPNGTFPVTIDYSGNTIVDGGTLRAANANAFSASSAHSLTNAGSTLDLNGFNQTVAGLTGVPGTFVTLGAGNLTTGGNDATTFFSGVMSGTGGLTKVGTGVLNISGANTYTGATNVNGGMLALNSANALSTQTAVTIGAGAELRSSNNQSVGSIAGAGLLNINGGNFIVGTNNTSTTFSGEIQGGIGRFLEKNGTGTLTISGTSTNFFGEIEVNAGTLVHNGNTSSGSLSVFAGATLMGTGRAGTTTIIGTLSPGNSIGTFTTNGMFFGANSTYRVEVSPTAADRTNSLNTVTIAGGTVTVVAESGQYAPTQTYTIINATQPLTGTFNSVTANLAFLTPSLSYDSRNVYLTLVSNGVSVAQFGQTPNQRAASAGLAAAGTNAPYTGPFTGLTVGDVPGALDQTTGESHASNKGVFVTDSATVRQAALSRIDQAFDTLTSAGMMNQFVMTETSTDPVDEGSRLIWGHLYGSAGVINADGNAAQTTSTSGGVLAGTDGDIGDWKIGVLAGAGLTSINARSTTGSSGDVSLGVYGGTEIGDGVLFKVGAAYTHHFINTRRNIVFPGVNDVVTASYSAGTAQLFGEISKEFDLGEFEVTPFAQLALVSHMTSAFTETGAPGALTSAATTTSAAFATLGVRAEHQFVLGDGMLVTASGSIGWRQAFAGMPAAVNSFAGGTPFTVTGAPVGSALVLSAGLNFDVSEDLNLSLNYDAAIGSNGSSHAIKLTLGGKF